ncbi:hypothetical protein SAMN04488498_12613 [Mesorhizobium albiziae]|uniref:Uncharacterized protein n=1 Tax=Neomesorhizobium albiziae TaxID=335020 RepID=A0A1I4EFB9_9HYPH|nr:hypothetical protein SAMN04488498_12613 [Mesorhizobium albiziae]
MLNISLETLNPEERKAIASAVLAYWTNFDGRIPRVSPSEKEWLSRELNTQDAGRLAEAVNSKGYALWTLEGLTSKLSRSVWATVERTHRQRELYMWMKEGIALTAVLMISDEFPF